MSKEYSIKPGYQSQLANYTISTDGDPYWTELRVQMSRFYQYAVYRLARQLIIGHKINSVIDIGCGVGTKLFDLIVPFCPNVTGVDQPEAIHYCKDTYGIGHFFVDDLEHPDKSLYDQYGLIICADVIEHLFDPDPLVELIKHISGKGSWIVLSTPERDKLRGKDCMQSTKREHVREWNAAEFKVYLESRGLQVVEQRTVFHVKPDLTKSVVRKEYWELIKNRRGLKTQQMVVAQAARDNTCVE